MRGARVARDCFGGRRQGVIGTSRNGHNFPVTRHGHTVASHVCFMSGTGAGSRGSGRELEQGQGAGAPPDDEAGATKDQGSAIEVPPSTLSTEPVIDDIPARK